MKKILIMILILFTFIPIVNANEELSPNSKSAIMIEVATKKIIYKKNEHEKLAPASMTKTMSLLLIMEAISSGQIKWTDSVTISEKAASMGGSQIFLEAGTTMKVEELVKGIAIASGNDATVAMAEKLHGSVEVFVEKMNEKAATLGLKNTQFQNPHGLDEEDHYTTANDMVLIALELIKYPDILNFTSIYEEYLNKPDGSSTWLVNTNRLVRFYEGMDGLKTGFTNTAGYCLTATAKRGDLRFISVVMGAQTSDARSNDTANMMNHGFNSYKLNTIMQTTKNLGKIKIERGKKESGELILKNDITELLKVNENTANYTFNIKTNNLNAPIKFGDVVGTIETIDAEGNIIREDELTIQETIEKANIWDLFVRNLKVIISGKKIIK